MAVPDGRLVAAADNEAVAEDGARGCWLCCCRRQRRRCCQVSAVAARGPFPHLTPEPLGEPGHSGPGTPGSPPGRTPLASRFVSRRVWRIRPRQVLPCGCLPGATAPEETRGSSRSATGLREMWGGLAPCRPTCGFLGRGRLGPSVYALRAEFREWPRGRDA